MSVVPLETPTTPPGSSKRRSCCPPFRGQTYASSSLVRRHAAARNAALHLECELRIAECTHFGDIQTFEFIRGRDTLADDDVHNPARHVRNRENQADQGADPNQLCHQLAGIPVK